MCGLSTNPSPFVDKNLQAVLMGHAFAVEKVFQYNSFSGVKIRAQIAPLHKTGDQGVCKKQVIREPSILVRNATMKPPLCVLCPPQNLISITPKSDFH